MPGWGIRYRPSRHLIIYENYIFVGNWCPPAEGNFYPATVCGKFPIIHWMGLAMSEVVFYLLDCHATNVARNDKRGLPRSGVRTARNDKGNTSHTRTGHKSRTSIRNNSRTSILSLRAKRSNPVAINLFAAANTVLWIATPLTWLAMTKEDCHATDVARNDKWGPLWCAGKW